VSQSNLLLIFDLVGIFVFALSGALEALPKALDVFGLVVIAGASSLGGGIVRDVLLGATPPAAFNDYRYLLAPLIAALVVFFLHDHVRRLAPLLTTLDAAGLALFSVAGAEKALRFNLGPLAAVGIAVITGIGGGIIRDVLLREVPRVLRKEIYAVASLVGASIVVAGDRMNFNRTVTALIGALIIFGIRMIAVLRKWNAPTASTRPAS
jgi:uncharacterized membrane protein YeiH